MASPATQLPRPPAPLQTLVSARDPIPLTSLPLGHSAKVLEISGPNARISRRLEDLGFVPGSLVRALRRAPLGDPIEYEVRGTRICLRATEAACIRVVPA